MEVELIKKTVVLDFWSNFLTAKPFLGRYLANNIYQAITRLSAIHGSILNSKYFFIFMQFQYE